MSNEKSIFIIEDNGINRLTLETILEDNNYLISGSFSKAEKAWEILSHIESKPDLVLIDINLAGEKDGIWLASNIRKHLNIPLIYLTAYGDEDTINRVKKTKPNGYLMKPYNEPTLLTTINIAIENFKNVNTNNNKSLYIKDNYIRIKLETQDILYIRSEGNYIEIVLDNKKHLVRSRLIDFLVNLPKDDFVQVHRRYVININKINILGNGFVSIKSKEIPISKTFKENFDKQLNLQ